MYILTGQFDFLDNQKSWLLVSTDISTFQLEIDVMSNPNPLKHT